MTRREWRGRAEDGEIVYYRAFHHGGNWSFQSTRKSDDDWHDHDILPAEVMEELREVLWNKHLRRRLPLKQVEQIDRLIEEQRADDGEAQQGSVEE